MTTLHGHNFGNKVYCNSKKSGNKTIFEDWKYCDNDDENTEENYQKRICPECGLNPTNDGHDPCISNLPGVDFACCGHGLKSTKSYKPAYIKFSNGEVKRFDSTEEIKEFVKNKVK